MTTQKNVTLSKAIEGFIIHRRAEGYSPATINIYRWAFERMLDYLGNQPLPDIKSEDIQRFYLWLQTDYTPNRKNGDTSPLNPSSVEKAWTTIRSFYNWATVELGIKRADQKIKRPKYKPKEIMPFSSNEVKAILKACTYTRTAQTTNRKAFQMVRSTHNRDRAIVLLLLDTGLRVSECARLTVGNVNTSTGEIFVDAFGTGQKTKSRHVYVGKQTLKALWRYLSEREDIREDDPLFMSASGQPMNRNSIRLLINELGKRAKVNNAHPHRFRHTFAIQYLRNNGDIFTLQRLLGHSTLQMVQHYLSIASVDIQEAHRKASPADRWHL